jgi:LysR family transcriptional activator of nhaA
MRINLNHLRYFRAVARTGNLTRAAERLNLSQSALSVQIRALEDRLGHPLFDRTGRGLELTEAGRIALDHAEAVHAAGEALVSALAGDAGARPLRVGVLATLSRNFVTGLLGPLLGEVRLSLRSGGARGLLDALAALEIDLMLTDRPAPGEGPARSVRLAVEAAHLVGPPAWFDGRGPEALARAHPMILPAPGSAMRRGVDRWLEGAGLSPRVAVESDDMATIRLMLRAGAGLGVVPPVVVRGEIEAGELGHAPAPPGLEQSFWAITVERRFPHPALATLLSEEAARRAASVSEPRVEDGLDRGGRQDGA